jgi:methylenetetrahydrofolate dehydrogenase (NADP+)/methenyltetrahydrofolate cyclohydrolase
MTVQVGEDPASKVYHGAQKKKAEFAGIRSELLELPASISQGELVKVITGLNRDPAIHGIIVHLPLPGHLDSRLIQWSIDGLKDVEGVTPYNTGRLFLGMPGLAPCTALSAVRLIMATGEPLRGKEVTIVGRSDIVGKPAAMMLLKQDCTVTICHSGTTERGLLAEHVSRAEILVASVGKPNVIKGEWIKPGATVIDVGINSMDGKIVGDVEFEEARQKARYITPVPGGVGAVTVAFLMQNLVVAAEWQSKGGDGLAGN